MRPGQIGTKAQQQMVQKVDLLTPKLDPNDVMARLQELERRVAALERRGQ
jgi:phage shock protein A